MGTDDIITVQPNEYDAVLYGHMTPAEAAAYLQDGRVVPRSFGETLRTMYPYADLQARLYDFFAGLPGAEERSVRRNIRNWLGSRHRPHSRRDLFGISFALRLTEQQLDHLLCLCTDYGIQYRNGWEAVFSWFLRSGRSWQEAVDFYDTLPVVPGLDQVSGREASRLTRSPSRNWRRATGGTWTDSAPCICGPITILSSICASWSGPSRPGRMRRSGTTP